MAEPTPASLTDTPVPRCVCACVYACVFVFLFACVCVTHYVPDAANDADIAVGAAICCCSLVEQVVQDGLLTNGNKVRGIGTGVLWRLNYHSCWNGQLITHTL